MFRLIPAGFRLLLGVSLLLTLLCAGTPRAPAAEDKFAQEPKPPEVKPVRWQKFGRNYRDIFIDGSGRAWFLWRETPFCSSNPKWVWLVCPELPDATIQIPGDNVHLGFDGKNRFWDIGRYGLGSTDVEKGTFTQRKPIGPDKLRRTPRGREQFLPFSWQMFEHSSGRLYFFDAAGVHTLDGDRWSYYQFDPPLPHLMRINRPHYSSPCVVEGPRGEVYVWTISSSTPSGLWVQDGAAWTHYTEKDHFALRSIDELDPQEDGTVSVQMLYGLKTTVTLPGRESLGSPVKKKPDLRREIRSARFSRRRRFDRLAALTGGELAAFGQVKGTDHQGRVYFNAAAPFLSVGGFDSMACFDPRQREDVPTLKVECIPARIATVVRVVCQDSEGRIWVRFPLQDHPFLSRWEDGRWTHFPDPTGWSADQYPGRVLVDQYGTWRMVPREEIGRHRLSDHEAARRAAPPMANPGFLQPLRAGALVAAERIGGKAYLFDGRHWTVYQSLKTLVEEEYGWLKEHLDNTVEPYNSVQSDSRPRLGLDAAGRVWLSMYEFHGAYDGQAWGKLDKGGFRLNAAGDRAIAGAFLRDTSVWPPKDLVASPDRHGRGCFDRQGRVWARGGDPYHVHRSDGNRFAKIEHPAEGLPLLEDSAGRFWCRRFEGWFLLLPDGSATELCKHPVAMRAPVVEQGGGIFWAFASDGLLRLRVEEPKAGKGKPKIVADTHYPRIVPQGEIRWMALDPHGNLWVATSYGRSGLYRIELPPVKGETR